MQRRKFLTTTLVTATASVVAKAQTKTPNKEGFIVKKGSNRSGKPTTFMMVNPNDVKISAKDTEGRLSMFEYIGTQKVGPPNMEAMGKRFHEHGMKLVGPPLKLD